MTTPDLKTAEGVAAFMRSSKNESEWNSNCDAVKAANGGYPDFWFATVIISGIAAQTSDSWK